jgi:chromosome segregation ATPase
MEKKLEELTDSINDIKTLVHSFHKTLENIEHRLSRLEKMDSIEHRVEVNQIDLSDIKESLQRIEEVQSKVLHDIKNGPDSKEDIQYINRRLDSHLVKIAKTEEDIIILKNK